MKDTELDTRARRTIPSILELRDQQDFIGETGTFIGEIGTFIGESMDL